MTDSHKTLTVLKPRVLKRKESRSVESNRRRPLTSLTPYRWATPAHTAMMDNGSIFWLRQMSGRVVRKESSRGGGGGGIHPVRASVMFWFSGQLLSISVLSPEYLCNNVV